MAIFDSFAAYKQEYMEFIAGFFQWYNHIGRSTLNFLHSVFDSIFNVLLVIAVLASILYMGMAVYAIFSKRKKQAITIEKSYPTVTVQIPTYNELVALRCAQKCIEFDYP